MQYNSIGRIANILDHNLIQNIRRNYTPMLTDYALIPAIHARVTEQFPDLDKTDTFILASACVYRMYSPASLLAARCSNAPAGMRKALAETFGYKNGTNINYFQNIARAHVKNPRYVNKIESIMEHFRSRSVNPIDWELGL